MGSGDGFIKRGTDKALIRKNQIDGQGVGENVLIRKVVGRTGGDPASGIQPTLQYSVRKVLAVIERTTPEEVVSSAGIYEYGDLRVDFLDPIKFSDERNGEIGDRMIYQGYTYRVVGRTQTQTIEGKDMVYRYVMRKVGDA